VVAPILGSMLLKIASWRVIFYTLAGFGVFSLLIVIPLEESLECRYEGSAFRSMGRLFVVMKNPGFSLLLLIFSIVPMPLMAFIAGSSYVYIEGFGLNEQTFSLFFSANAVCAMIGPILYLRVSRWLHSNIIITACYVALALSGILVIFVGPLSPYFFATTIMLSTLAVTTMRPPSANLMLEQQEGDTGSASSLINFFGMIMGSIGMILISIGSGHLILFIGLMQIIIGSLGFISWFMVKNRAFIVQSS
jgi:MFS transporter, DHA1 family, multidrug resistance protein